MTLIALVAITALAGTPDAGTSAAGGSRDGSIDQLLTSLRPKLCATAGRACEAVTAFLRGKPAVVTGPLLTIARRDVFALRGDTFEKDDSAGLVLAVEPAKEKRPAQVTWLTITPDNANEAKELNAFLERLAAGKHDPKSQLYKMMADGAARQPHFDAKVADGSLTFQAGGPLRGGFLRTTDKRLVLIQFAGTPELPKLLIAHFPK